MNGRILLLRACYWAGAIIDGLAAVQLLVPSVFSMTEGIPGFNPGNDFVYFAGTAASLMLGWTVLLLWADRKPAERRGVLLLTVFPIIVSLITVRLCSFAVGFMPMGPALGLLGLQVGLAVVFLIAYVRASPSSRPNE